MLLNLSELFVNRSDLMTLGIIGFGWPNFEVEDIIGRNKGYTDPALELLIKWWENIEDDQEAYEKLCLVLGKIGMNYYKNVLK